MTNVSNNLGNGFESTVENATDNVTVSSHNVFKTIADALGFDLSSLSFMHLLGSLIMLILLIGISKIATAIISKFLKHSRMSESMKKFFVKAIKYIMYFLSILIFCDSIGIPITSILAVFSLLGLAISLSIQNLLGNVLSGVTLLMLRPFEIGDYIETDIEGTVESIGLFYTSILTLDNKKVFIPNEKIIQTKLINYHAKDTRRIDLTFNAAYDCDIELVKTALKEAIESVPSILTEPEPIIGVANYSESAILYDVKVWVKTEDFLAKRYELREAVAESYINNNIKMAYNRLEVEIIK